MRNGLVEILADRLRLWCVHGRRAVSMDLVRADPEQGPAVSVRCGCGNEWVYDRNRGEAVFIQPGETMVGTFSGVPVVTERKSEFKPAGKNGHKR